MNDKPIMVQFVDPFTILVVNSKGSMRQLFTPFRVQVIQKAGTIPNNAWVYVDGVWQDKKDRLFYMVGNKLYPYRHFRLQILINKTTPLISWVTIHPGLGFFLHPIKERLR